MAALESSGMNLPLEALDPYIRDNFAQTQQTNATDYRAPPDASLSTWSEILSGYVRLWHVLGFSGYPVLIIDEANELMKWSRDERSLAELKDLLNLLTVLSKQSRQCHIILISSDFGFLQWYEQMLGKGYNRAEYLDNFKEDDAKEFLKTLLGEKAASLTDPVWREVFEVVGGNPLSLENVAEAIGSTNSPKQALQMAMAETRDLISSVVGEPCSPRPLFLPFAKLVVAMLASEPPNIEVKSAIEKLKDPALYPATSSAATDAGQREDTLLLRDGKPIRDVAWAALNQLVASNLILVRPFSVWAGDHGSDALGMGERIVLPSSPTVLKLMRMLQPEFEAALDAALMKRKMMELDEAEDRLASVLWWNFLKKQQAKRASESKREELASLKRQGRHGGPSHWKVEDS
eukprot:CAMPEP_0202337692 /NCGR_PEP_ID=MMETSP1126-20121109/276_1 /ASSEMBLY_ACC=CAM_ASM_000457 /TAXON_ID=3047 /ORGANISM="Dunaliella tertiolecta, Strain CCMP1320" /LENGTH=404 /DNA_ID=CAMNT_0048927941 /DNA_START=518 /DNA_END=1732 /DNA_ORIENTATION=-